VADGVTPNETIRFFNITNGGAGAAVMDAKISSNADGVLMYNYNSENYAGKPEILSGSFSIDPAECVVEGCVVRTEQDGAGKTWYIVEIDESALLPTDPSDEVPEAVGLKTAWDVQNALGSSLPGSYKLANDITVELGESAILVMSSVMLDLNGYTLTIKQPFMGNVISVQCGYETATLLIMDSSSAGTGTIRAVITRDGAGRDLFRVNQVGGITNHLVLLGGNYEYVAAEGITPNHTIRFFNITNGEQTATVMDAKMSSNLSWVTMHNTTNQNYCKAPVIYGGSFTIDPSVYVAEGCSVRWTVDANGKDWYVVTME